MIRLELRLRSASAASREPLRGGFARFAFLFEESCRVAAAILDRLRAFDQRRAAGLESLLNC